MGRYILIRISYFHSTRLFFFNISTQSKKKLLIIKEILIHLIKSNTLEGNILTYRIMIFEKFPPGANIFPKIKNCSGTPKNFSVHKICNLWYFNGKIFREQDCVESMYWLLNYKFPNILNTQPSVFQVRRFDIWIDPSS